MHLAASALMGYRQPHSAIFVMHMPPTFHAAALYGDATRVMGRHRRRQEGEDRRHDESIAD